MTKLFASASLLALSLPSLAAAQATPQGAADLTAVFQTYLGTTPGVVNVVADGEAYAVTLDAGPFIAMVPPEAGATISMSPLTMRLTDRGDGTWGVTQNQAFSLRMEVPGELSMDLSIADLSCSGTYDTAIRAFAQNDCTMEGMALKQVATPPGGTGQSVTDMTLDRVTLSSTSRPGAGGGVDSEIAYTSAGLSQTMSEATGEGMPPLELTVRLAESQDRATVTGMRNDALLAALAWVVANPDEARMMANRARIKEILADALPLWEMIEATGRGTGLEVVTPLGPVTAEALTYDIGMAGAVADGRIGYGLGVEGLALAPGMVPPFAEPLVPSSLTIGFGVEGYDAAAAAQKILGLLDLAPGAEPGPAFEGELLQALLPEGTVDVVLAPGGAGNATWRLSWEGRMQAGPNMAIPTGTAKVTATGYDAAVAALDAAPDEVKREILPAMGIARQFAQEQDDGSLVWEIDASVPGSFKVNGMDLMGMQ